MCGGVCVGIESRGQMRFLRHFVENGSYLLSFLLTGASGADPPRGDKFLILAANIRKMAFSVYSKS